MTMTDYEALQTAFSTVKTGLTWPKHQPTQAGLVTLGVNEASVSITDLQTVLGTISQEQTIKLLPTSLPPFLPSTITGVLAHALTINALSLGVDAPSATGSVPVNAFSVTLGLGIPQFSIDNLLVTNLELQLNVVCLGNRLAWSLAFSVTGTWGGLTCTATIGVPDWSLMLQLQASPDTLLSAFDPSTSVASLTQKLGLTSSGTVPPEVTMLVAADLSGPTRTYEGSIALSGVTFTGHHLTLDTIAVDVAYTTGTPSSCAFTVSAEVTIGDVTIEGTLQEQSGSIVFSGEAWCTGLSVTHFLTHLFEHLGVDQPAGLHLPDVDLTALTLSLTDTSGAKSFSLTCAGAITLESLGTSFAFDFLVSYTNSDLKLQLQLGDLVLDVTDADHTKIFATSASGPTAGLTLGDLVRLMRIEALYGVADAIPIEVTGMALVLAPPGTGMSSHHLLFALALAPTSSLTNPILSFVTGGHGLAISGATLLAANAPWSSAELANLQGLPAVIQLPSDVRQGPSVVATLAMGSTTTVMPLAPQGQMPAGSPPGGPTSPPAPQAVTAASAVRWFDVQKQLGPIYLGRVGFALGHSASNDRQVTLAADATFTLGPFAIDLVDFSLGFPLVKDFSPLAITVSLAGMNLAYSKPPLTISGGFLYTTDGAGHVSYIGDATVQTASLCLAAAGQYAKDAHGKPSLALLAVLNSPPLGGPVCCFVTGLAAGIGYNSRLEIPARAAEVADFALVTIAMPPAPNTTPPDPMTLLESRVKPMAGEDWLAVGLLFRSFELIQSVALLTATFGQDFKLAILGQSEISIPPASSQRIAYAQVDVEATYSPSARALQVFGLLMPPSYVISPDCHLTGGFAFILKDSGDFVATFGGYAPDFAYASRGYPAVPRLQLLWRVDDHTEIKGDEYFAITPAAMMAGGALQATWSCSLVAAWFSLSLDFLIQWRPFAYSGGFAVTLGVSVDLNLGFIRIHFTFQVGASLQVAGPPFHGTAAIDLDVISFTVHFGPSPNPETPLTWSQFRAMLPGNAAHDATASALLNAKVTGGLIKDLSQAKGAPPPGTSPAPVSPDWVVDGTHFSITLQSSLPVTAASSGATVSVTATPLPVTIGILPMAITDAWTTLDVTLTDAAGTVYSAGADPTSALVVEPLASDMAPAHWGTMQPTGANAPALQATNGYRLYGGRPTPDRSSPVLVSTLASAPVAVTARSTRTATTHPF